MKKRRVVITGLGIVCPVGNTITEAWRNILNGKSGIALLKNIDTEGQAVTFGGSVKHFDINEYLSPKEAKKWTSSFIMVWLPAFKPSKIAE